jgi:hypothetical protein
MMFFFRNSATRMRELYSDVKKRASTRADAREQWQRGRLPEEEGYFFRSMRP